MKTVKTILCLATLALIGGCVDATTTSTGEINTEPLTIDPAMQQRTWEPTVAYYQNGDVKTQSTGFAYSSNAPYSQYDYYVTDTGTYLVNLITSPWTFYQQRDGVVNTGTQLPPTYTAVPPLPPSFEAPMTLDVTAPSTQPTP